MPSGLLRLVLAADRYGTIAGDLEETFRLDVLLYQEKPNDPVTLGVLSAGLLGISLLASYLPARRATRVEPWTSLRAD